MKNLSAENAARMALNETVRELTDLHVTETVDVLANAFLGYPVMRYVIGADAPDYPERLRAMLRFFVLARVYRGEHMLGISDAGGVCAAALVSRPGGKPSPTQLDLLRAELWERLGADAKARYEIYTAACRPFAMDAPHMHVNVIGVHDRARGRGLGRTLMDHIHGMSRDDASSVGVTLTTEEAGNVSFYQRLGYELVGHARVAPALETWGFFRADSGSSP